MSDTPRTDACEGSASDHLDCMALTEHARQLERELADAVAKERERCAKVCEEFYSVEGVAQKCAEAIRKGE
jgi:hypothetical protein